ncbi:F-box/kelch-repeat protein At3g06240-like [Diospyros lotus]|uniref:F-box/kelch-repeat protein At3g06240-like n=1 Tax=Diospyros lotus TaxID=55363 RepID=UPI002257C2D5|nr:F-box/kelch-repeat protein At3g06240-like [Diospyros lotus]
MCYIHAKKAIKLCFGNNVTTYSKGEEKGEILGMIYRNKTTEVIPQRELPEDVIIEILSRLLVKSLMRFRCVCKRWYKLSLSSAFINIHLNNNMDKKKSSIFCSINSDLTTKHYKNFLIRVNGAITSLRVPHINWGSYIVGSSNGLVCISSYQEKYTLWNPATKQFECLPELVYEKKHALWNSNILLSMSGFVFDGKTKDYKIVKIIVRRDKNRDTAQINVFTLSSNSWRTIELNLQFQNQILYSKSIIVNECIYWTEVLLEEETNRSHLCWFDMVDEEFKEIQAPYDICEFTSTLDIYRGSLAMFAFKYPYDKFDMWVMNKHGDGTNYSWRKQLSIGPIAMIAVEPIGLWKEDEDELVVFNTTRYKPKNLFTFHPITREIKKFWGDYPLNQIFPYCDSLVQIPKLN